jgi:uncharacterized protein YggE
MKAVLATLVLLAGAGIASADVTVNGTGKIVYVPDIGYVSVGVSSDGQSAEEAWKKNSATVAKLFAALNNLGIDPKDLQTSSLNISPRYTHPKDQEPQLIGYTVTYELRVTVRKLGEMGKVLDSLVDNGANRNMGITFGINDVDKLLDQARAKAVADARKKAELFVSAAGASLGPVVSITDSQAMPFRTLEYAVPAKGSAADLPIAAGQQELTVHVTLTFAINHVGPRQELAAHQTAA